MTVRFLGGRVIHCGSQKKGGLAAGMPQTGNSLATAQLGCETLRLCLFVFVCFGSRVRARLR
jgi:hypothetical protein